jgi:hypothetical protein
VSELRKNKTFKLYGDDYVIVDSNGDMFSYLSDLSIYKYHINLFPELKASNYEKYLRRVYLRNFLDTHITGMNYLRRGFNKIVSEISDRKDKWREDFVKVPVTKVFSQNQLGKTAKISAALLLNRYRGEELKIEKLLAVNAVKEIYGVLKVEFKDALQYLYMLAAFGQFDLSAFERRQKEILNRCFSKIPCYRVSIPDSSTTREYTNFMKTVFERDINFL